MRAPPHPPSPRRSPPGGGGLAAASAPPPPGLRDNGPGRRAAGSPAGLRQRAGTGRGGAALRSAPFSAAAVFPAPCRPRRGGRGSPPAAGGARPRRRGAGGASVGSRRPVLGGQARLGAAVPSCVCPPRLSQGEVAGAGASLHFPPSRRGWGRPGQTGAGRDALSQGTNFVSGCRVPVPRASLRVSFCRAVFAGCGGSRPGCGKLPRVRGG